MILKAWNDSFAGFELIHMDNFIDDLLREERMCDIILPRIQVRNHCIFMCSPNYLIPMYIRIYIVLSNYVSMSK